MSHPNDNDTPWAHIINEKNEQIARLEKEAHALRKNSERAVEWTKVREVAFDLLELNDRVEDNGETDLLPQIQLRGATLARMILGSE